MNEEDLRILSKLVEVYREHGESSYAPSQAEVYFALRDAMPVVESIVERDRFLKGNEP